MVDNIATMMTGSAKWGDDYPSLRRPVGAPRMTRLAARRGDDYPNLLRPTTAPRLIATIMTEHAKQGDDSTSQGDT